MKTSKIATIIIIAALGATLIGASALAYLGTRATQQPQQAPMEIIQLA